MSPPLLGVEKGGQSNVALLACSASSETILRNESKIEERNYMGLSDCSSVDSSNITSDDNNSTGLNLKATELRLGLPGCQSPERDSELCLLSSAKLDEKPLFPLHPSKDSSYMMSQKAVVSGNKRGFSDAMDDFSEGKFTPKTEVNAMLSSRPLNSVLKVSPGKDNPGSQLCKMKEGPGSHQLQDRPRNDDVAKRAGLAANSTVAPASKAQVVGWPPVRSYFKNTLASSSKTAEETDGKTGAGSLFVKVSMDGAPYLRKVDLNTYSAYKELSSALEKMFSCFTIGQYGSHGASGGEKLSESKLKDLLNGSEYVLTYEDKDGDWMLVGDVPWEMFIDACKRLRIMKSSDAIGLAPRAIEKFRNRN